MSKLRASDGSLLGTFTVPTGAYAIAFDGQNVWVTGAEIVELRASDGAQIAIFHAPRSSTTGVAFDGSSIWVSLLDTNTVGKL